MSDILVNGLKPESRPLKPRKVIWASEIGYSMYDRYHKMRGVPPTESFTSRTYFKFLIGNLVEYGLVRIFERAGMVVEVQKGGEKCRIEVPGAYPVEGKYDAIISSNGNWDEALFEIKNNPLREDESFFDRYAQSLAIYCKEKFPQGFNRELFEIKTINSMVFRAYMKKGTLGANYPHHKLQLYTYMKALGANVGNVFYVSKDDGLFHIERVEATKELESEWLKDIKKITKHVESGSIPEFPEPYSLQNGRYKVNWGSVGSNYLHLYNPKIDYGEFLRETKRTVARLNRELKKKEKESK